MARTRIPGRENAPAKSALQPDPTSSDEYDPNAPEEDVDSSGSDMPHKSRIARKPQIKKFGKSAPATASASVPAARKAGATAAMRLGKMAMAQNLRLNAGGSKAAKRNTGPGTGTGTGMTKEDQDRYIIYTSGMYKVKDILQEKREGKQLKYLVDWKPTWETKADANLTKQLLDAWEEIKEARRLEKEENINHTLITLKSHENYRQTEDYQKTRDAKLRDLSHMTKSQQLSSTEAIEWFGTFQDEILRELELFLFTPRGLDGSYGQDSGVIFPRSNTSFGEGRSKDKYALWKSPTASKLPSGILNNTGNDGDGDTTMQDQDDDQLDDDDDNEEIILSLIPNPYYHDNATPNHMPSGTVYIRGLSHLRQAMKYFETNKKRPPVRKLFEMLTEAFGTVVRLAPRLEINSDGLVVLTSTNTGGYEFVAREIVFTKQNTFEWFVVPEAVKSMARAHQPAPAPAPVPVPQLQKVSNVPSVMKNFTNPASRRASTGGNMNGSQAAASGSNYFQTPAEHAAPNSNTNRGRASLPSLAQQSLSQSQRHQATTAASLTQVSRTTSTIPAKRKNKTSQKHGRQNNSVGAESIYDPPTSSGESSGGEENGDRMDIDQGTSGPTGRVNKMAGTKSHQMTLSGGNVGGNRDMTPASERGSVISRRDKGNGKSDDRRRGN